VHILHVAADDFRTRLADAVGGQNVVQEVKNTLEYFPQMKENFSTTTPSIFVVTGRSIKPKIKPLKSSGPARRAATASTKNEGDGGWWRGCSCGIRSGDRRSEEHQKGATTEMARRVHEELQESRD